MPQQLCWSGRIAASRKINGKPKLQVWNRLVRRGGPLGDAVRMVPSNGLRRQAGRAKRQEAAECLPVGLPPRRLISKHVATRQRSLVQPAACKQASKGRRSSRIDVRTCHHDLRPQPAMVRDDLACSGAARAETTNHDTSISVRGGSIFSSGFPRGRNSTSCSRLHALDWAKSIDSIGSNI